jgi:RNA polymerase subunit RPABC4/transcription elongation factor Spt4
MIFRNLFLLTVIISVTISCTNYSSDDNNSNNVGYVVIMDSSMTLMEVAKANNIGEPFLRSKLNIPMKIGKKYDVATMAMRFKFDLDTSFGEW